MVAIARRSTTVVSRQLVNQYGKSASVVIGGTTGLSPVFSSRTNASSFHSLASSSSLQFQTTTTNKDQKRFFAAGKRDYYSVLGVPKGSDKSSIKKAYFKLAKEHHPDTNNGDAKSTEKFKEASEAYEILSDDKKREMYDQFGHAGVDPNAGFGGGENPFAGGEFNFRDGSFHFSHGGPGDIDAEELFEAFFGGGRKGRRAKGPRRGADLQMHTTLTFHEAVFGTTKTLKVRYQVMDNDTGRVERKEREVSVDIPAGVDNGMNLRMEGQGADGEPGAQRGNLLITIIVKEDGYFQRDDMDVHTEIPISIIQALLGGTVDVKTLSGEVEMKIPKGCHPDTKLMLRGKGITRLHGKAKGNQIVHLKIQIPKSLTARQEELLREFDEESKASGKGISGKIAKAAGSVFEKVFGSGKNGKNESIKKGDDTDVDESSEKKVAN